MQTDLPWINLTSTDQFLDEWNNSSINTLLIFKHSTRCIISKMALKKFENDWEKETIACKLLFLDLLEYRTVSNCIAETTLVVHQSPQVIVIKDKKAVYFASHEQISFEGVKNYM
jgi:bacillithiol system protein YtxJ